MIGRATRMFLITAGMMLMATSTQAVNITIDFETEDDLTTPLINGQSVFSTPRPNNVNPNIPFSTDTRLEFGNLFTVSSTIIGSDGHLGPAIFDSDPADNPNTLDPDLLVGLGNLMILHRDEGPNTHLDPTYGLVFNNPNDEATFEDRGSIVFDFIVADVHPISIDLVDIDNNVEVDVILTDINGLQRIYTPPNNWTTQITNAPNGYQTLSLETLLNQPAEPNATGGDATVVEDLRFNDQKVVRLEVQFLGVSPSGALDNLVFAIPVIPEPSTALLSGIAAAGCFISRGRRRKLRC